MKTVLCVDDDKEYQKLLPQILKKMGYESVVADTGLKALELTRAKEFDLILLDVTLPKMDGFRVMEEIRKEGRSRQTPIVFVTARSEKENVANAIKFGAADYIVKPFDTGLFLHKVSRFINMKVEAGWHKLKPEQEQVLSLTLATLDKAFNAIQKNGQLPYAEFMDVSGKMTRVIEKGDVKGVLDAVKDHDAYTFVHSMRVGIFLSLLAKNFGGFSAQDIQILTTGGTVHDVGKAKTPLKVLNKPGKFEPEEWLEMQNHVGYTVEMLRRTPEVPESVIEIAWNHHERIDGSGYPRRLKGEQLGMLSRMAAICDVYVALTDRRVYKPGYPPEQAIGMMRDPNHIDQSLLAEFAAIIEGLYKIKIPA
ncbi:MAG: response regulator [Nitrospinae bacterium]|nr:response regulator [Nitrospinota bacterium]